ncbi:hypothetical protein F5Y10DRAFT_231273 [Nemania abortiva]|nr:hypothetical protein F5Y10DRAFT_231273 [Nemania abortiva]
MRREDICAMLQAKEEARQQRRDLKESGDWLGVQGADPYSSEFAVLTPTSTLSSETTPTSTKNRLAELSQMQKDAKLAYEEAKLEEMTEREMIHLKKGQSKLKKMEHAKEGIRKKQQGFPIWSQHRRRWSSAAAAGPGLSPIPQSIKSYEVEGSLDEVAAVPIRNFSRPARSNEGSAIDQSKPAEIVGNSENTEPPKRAHRETPSTGTIVHNTVANIDVPNMSKASTGVLYPAVFSDTDDAPVQEQNNDKPFLWKRRRRMTDPGKLVKGLSPLMIHSPAGKTEGNLVSNSHESPPVPRLPSCREPKDHFSDLLIPDSRLHFVPYPEQVAAMGKSMARMERGPSPATATRPIESSHSEARGKPALGIATNLSDCREPQTSPQVAASDTKEATATSSQSKPKGNTKPTSVCQKDIPRRSSSFQARLTPAPRPYIQAQKIGQTWHLIQRTPLRGMGEYQDIHRQSNSQVDFETEAPDNHINVSTSECHGRDVKGSASIPTITITGFDPSPQLQLEGTQSHMEIWNDSGGSAVNADGIPPIHSPQNSNQALCGESATRRKWGMAMLSHHTTPQNDSQSSVVAHEIREPDTTLTGLATLGVGPTRAIQTDGPRQNPGDTRKRYSWEKIEEIGVAISPPRNHETNQGRKAQVQERKMNGGGLQRSRKNNKVREAHRRHEPSSEHRDSMIQEAARIAMRRSRAKEVVTRSRTPSRTPSPRTQDTKEAAPAIPTARDLKGNDSDNGNAGTDLPFENITTSPGTNHENKNGNARDSGETIMMFVLSFLITMCMVWFGLACAWWVMVKPAFDQRSHLWKRKRRRETTWEDVGVFAAAGVFFVVTALAVAAGVRTGFWVALKL